MVGGAAEILSCLGGFFVGHCACSYISSLANTVMGDVSGMCHTPHLIYGVDPTGAILKLLDASAEVPFNAGTEVPSR